MPRAITLWERRLLALLILLFLVRDLPWRLDDYDQAKQAFTSLEMIDGGAWWFQHKPGFRGLATKPPLVGWMSAAAYTLTGGNWEIAWRLPSLLAAVALVVLLWRAGERLWPGRGGLVAAAAVGFNLLTPRLAMLVRTDTVLTLWITLLGLIVWRHVRPGGPAWTPRARWTVFGLMVATMMTKGPIVYAFLLPGMLVHWWVGHRRGEPAARLWGGWWPWTLPLLPFAFWLERGIVTVPGFYDEVVAHEFLGRFTVGEQAVHHNQPVYFYVAQLAAHWLPWSVLFAAVALRANGVWRTLWREPGTRWLVCWAAGGLIALSLVPSKRTDRIFPAVPALCLVLTAALSRRATSGGIRRAGYPGPDTPRRKLAATLGRLDRRGISGAGDGDDAQTRRRRLPAPGRGPGKFRRAGAWYFGRAAVRTGRRQRLDPRGRIHAPLPAPPAVPAVRGRGASRQHGQTGCRGDQRRRSRPHPPARRSTGLVFFTAPGTGVRWGSPAFSIARPARADPAANRRARPLTATLRPAARPSLTRRRKSTLRKKANGGRHLRESGSQLVEVS